MGRPAVKIDWEKVDQLLERGCIGTEIAGYFGMHPDTFYRHSEVHNKMGFAAYFQQKRAKHNAILRETQYNIAVKGNVSMLIWLGKQYLNQQEPKIEEIPQTGERIIKIVNYTDIKKENA